MSEPLRLAKIAREHLASALRALQSEATVPDELIEVADPIAEAMSVLHRIERSGGAALEGRETALAKVREALDRLVSLKVSHPMIDVVTDAVAMSIGKVAGLARYSPEGAGAGRAAAPGRAEPTESTTKRPGVDDAASAPAPEPMFVPSVLSVAAAPPPAPQPAAAMPPMIPQPFVPAPGPQPVFVAPVPLPQPEPAAPALFQASPPPAMPAPHPQPVASVPAHLPQPIPEAPVVPAISPVPAPAPVPSAAPALVPTRAPTRAAATPAPEPVARQPAAAPILTPAGAPTIDVEMGTHSASNFYKGLGGSDVIEHGGIFVATYRVQKLGATVHLRVLLPGNYEFLTNAVVRWTRESGVSDDSAAPGFGARIMQISQEGRQLVQRYTRNREPIFYDDL